MKIVKLHENLIKFSLKNLILFVIAVNFIKVVRYKHEISLVKDAKPNQEVEVVRYNREFVVTVIVITEFDCILFILLYIIQKLKTQA